MIISRQNKFEEIKIKQTIDTQDLPELIKEKMYKKTFQGIDIDKCDNWEKDLCLSIYVKRKEDWKLTEKQRDKLKKIKAKQRREKTKIKQYKDISFQKWLNSQNIDKNKCNNWEQSFLPNIYSRIKKGWKLTVKQQSKLENIKSKQREIKIFKVNEHITLKLENNKTIILIDRKVFNQCKYLLLNIPKDEIEEYDYIESVDDIAERLNHQLEGNSNNYNYKITPEQEFQAHCSNIQAWVEYDYDTRILHSNLSFPLLKKLTEVGDLKAKRVFKEEIAERYIEGNDKTREFLNRGNYLSFLNKEENQFISSIIKEEIKKDDIDDIDNHDIYNDDDYAYAYKYDRE